MHPLSRRLHGPVRDLEIQPGRSEDSLSARFWHGHRRRQQHHPRGRVLQLAAHPGLRLRRLGPGQGAVHRCGRLHLPERRPDHRIRPQGQDEEPPADDDRRPRLDLHRCQVLGFVCHRRRAGGHSDRCRRERGRGGQGIRDQEGQDQQGPRAGPPHRHLFPLPGQVRRHHRAAERRGHPQRRGRIRGRKIRRQVHRRAEMGPGRQGHRRRDPGEQPRVRPVPQEPRLHRRPGPVLPGGEEGLREGRHPRLCPPQPAGRHQSEHG